MIAKSIKAVSNKEYNMFGKLYYIFPIGKFNYSWLRALDLNIDFARTG
jgi:hypothetical protein